MKKPRVLSICLLILMLLSCHQKYAYNNLLLEAERFLPSYPDSADICLRLIKGDHLHTQAERAHYALLRVMTDAISGEDSHNDSLVRLAYRFYQHQSDYGFSSDHTILKRFAQSALYMGDWYAEQDSLKLSEDCFRQAISCSERIQDWRTNYLSYARLAEQVQWANEEDALKLIEQAILAYNKSNDNVCNLLSLYGYAANYSCQSAYNGDKDYTQALEYSQKAHSLAKDNCLTDHINETLVSIAEIYWAMGEHVKALEYARQVNISHLDTYTDQVANMKIAQYYLSLDSVDKAKELLLCPQNIENIELNYLYTRILTKVFALKSEQEPMMQYLDSAFACSEKMFLDALKTKDEYYRDNIIKTSQNAELQYRTQLRTWFFTITISILVIASLLVVWLLVLKIRMHRERRKNAVKLRKYELERSIEEKRRNKYEMQLLREREQALAESYQKKTATIKHLQNFIIDRTDVTMKLMDDKTRVKMSSKEWSDIEVLLDEIDNKSISKIRTRYKHISVEDIRLCIMVRLRMSNPAIGSIYDITPSAVQHRKQTLKKKVFGVTDPHLTLNDVIKSL